MYMLCVCLYMCMYMCMRMLMCTHADMCTCAGAHADLYVATPDGQLPSWVAPGDVLVGALQLDRDKTEVSKLPLVYEAPPHAAKPKEEEAAGGKAGAA